MDRVTNISWRTSNGATLGGFAYEYDAVGRITSRSHALGTNAFDRVYSYDDLDRLASDGDVAYTYDAAGSRMNIPSFRVSEQAMPLKTLADSHDWRILEVKWPFLFL